MNMRYTLADPGTNPAHEGGGGEEGRLCDQAILPRARAGSRHLSEKWGHGPYTALLAASCHARARRGLCIWEAEGKSLLPTRQSSVLILINI